MTAKQLCNDPYRILFPIAFVNLIIGLGVWLPSLIMGGSYPLFQHMQLLMQATMGCFVFGFLLTVLPKLWNIPGGAPLPILLAVAVCFVLQPIALFLDMRLLMTGSYLLVHLIVVVFIVMHFSIVLRTLNPFINVVYVGVLVSGFCAALPFVRNFIDVPSLLPAFVNNLNAQGTMLLLTAAVVPIILARIRGATSVCGASAGTVGIKMIVPSILAGAFIASYYPVNYQTSVLPMLIIFYRAFFVFLLFSHGMKLWKLPRGEAWFTWGVYFSLWSIIAGIVLPALCPPAMRIILEHLIYISGFVLLILVVSARIACGHAGAKDFIEQDKLGMGLIIGSMFTAVLSRIGGYWSTTTEGHERHLIYAVVFVSLAIIVWFVRYGKYILRYPKQSG